MGYDSGYYAAGWYDRGWYSGQNVDELAELAEAERDLMHYRAKVRRERLAQTALLKASTEMKPAAEPAPVAPNPALVAQIAAQLTNVRSRQGTTSGWGPGVFLPPI